MDEYRCAIESELVSVNIAIFSRDNSIRLSVCSFQFEK